MPRRIPWSWVTVIALALLAFGLGIVGFSKHLAAIGESAGPRWQAVYLTLQLFTLESGAVAPVPFELQIARFLAPLVAAYALLRAVLALMSVEAQRGWIWLRGGHVIVCGLGQKGSRLVEQLRAEGKRVIVIESDKSNDALAYARELNAVVLMGAANDEWVLRKAFVDRAAAIVSVTGDDHANVEAAVLAHALNDASRRAPLRCMIHVTDSHLERVLRSHDLYSQQDDPFELEFFNTYEIAARVMLRDPPPLTMPHGTNAKQPHLLIVGLGQLGQTLLLRAARDWRIDHGEAGSRLQVTIIDREAEARRDWLQARYPQLGDVVDLHSLSMDVHSHSFISGAFHCDAVTSESPFAAAYICLSDDSLAMFAALNLRRCLPANMTPIVVGMSQRGGMSTIIQSTDGTPSNVRVAGLLDIACTWELLSGGAREVFAQALHQSYVANRLKEDATASDDPTLAPWDRLPEELRRENRQQVDQIRSLLEKHGFELVPRPEGDIELISFQPEEVEALARAEHRRWVEEHHREGWSYGPRKDRERRVSPFLVPWEELSDEAREYNRGQSRSLPRVLAKGDYAIQRRATNRV